jgi:WD40 repeat protein
MGDRVEHVFIVIHHKYGVKMSPNGENVVTVSSDKTAGVWNTKGGDLAGHSNELAAFSFASNDLLCAASWDVCGIGKRPNQS